MPNKCLPDHLKGKRHDDYTFPFNWIKRSLTSWCLFQPPILIFGYKVYDWSYIDGKTIEATGKKWYLFPKQIMAGRKLGPNPVQSRSD